MAHYQQTLTLRTRGYAFHDFTAEVRAVVAAAGVRTGLCTLFVRHTSASLLVQENADPSVREDLARFMTRLAPEGADSAHGCEGADDMPAHIRSALTSTSESIPVTDGGLALGTWQGIYLWEHRARGHRREVLVHVASE